MATTWTTRIEHDPTEGPMTLERAQAMMETALGTNTVTVTAISFSCDYCHGTQPPERLENKQCLGCSMYYDVCAACTHRTQCPFVCVLQTAPYRAPYRAPWWPRDPQSETMSLRAAFPALPDPPQAEPEAGSRAPSECEAPESSLERGEGSPA